tara:strand:- start:535 stop:750 length:216 start_codon:yes stop_codon:yes gene_type:complete
VFFAVERNSSFIFLVLDEVLEKNKCAVCALAFLVQMFNLSTISALLTTLVNTNLSKILQHYGTLCDLKQTF